jgi:hypothetical protein
VMEGKVEEGKGREQKAGTGDKERVVVAPAHVGYVERVIVQRDRVTGSKVAIFPRPRP